MSSMFMCKELEQQVGAMSMVVIRFDIVMGLVSHESWDCQPMTMFLDSAVSVRVRKIVRDFTNFNVLACCLEYFQWKKQGLKS